MKTGQYILMFVAIFAMVAVLAISGCKKKETYTVTFDANGGTGEMSELVFTEGEPRALAGNLFSYQDHTFKCWNTMKNGTGTSYDDRQRITVTSDMTLYAQWKKIVTFVTVTFDANGGTGEMQPQRYIVGSPQALRPNTFTNPNTPFINWNTAADGSGTAYANTQEITISRNITLYAQWGKKYVDLGLPSGTLWAICNVGADVPEEFGDYFAWGETTPKDAYSWENYSLCNGTAYSMTKYCNNSNFGTNGFTDNLTTLEAVDDAATANWGEGWRMPTEIEMRELIDNCTVTSTTLNEVVGNLFTGRNGNSIFLPAAGIRGENATYDDEVGSYWSSSLTGGHSAWYIFAGGNCDVISYPRCFGLTVRPVYQPHN